ncbi:hypothetical protein BHM03_00010154 [Ensete ventricosum]|nr:hypothetical protein BHM03_00010154 [Ensete ventricosum]
MDDDELKCRIGDGGSTEVRRSCARCRRSPPPSPAFPLPPPSSGVSREDEDLVKRRRCAKVKATLSRLAPRLLYSRGLSRNRTARRAHVFSTNHSPSTKNTGSVLNKPRKVASSKFVQTHLQLHQIDMGFEQSNYKLKELAPGQNIGLNHG